MTQEEKDLLLKDLCARLPYGVKCCIYNFGENAIRIKEDILWSVQGNNILTLKSYVEKGEAYMYHQIKPYLFPISSMTEEQKEEYYSLADDVTIKPEQGSYFGIKIHCIKLGISDNPHEGVWDWIDLDAIDWLNKNHFDYRGLIEKGLAIDATGLNIY